MVKVLKIIITPTRSTCLLYAMRSINFDVVNLKSVKISARSAVMGLDTSTDIVAFASASKPNATTFVQQRNMGSCSAKTILEAANMASNANWAESDVQWVVVVPSGSHKASHRKAVIQSGMCQYAMLVERKEAIMVAVHAGLTGSGILFNGNRFAVLDFDLFRASVYDVQSVSPPTLEDFGRSFDLSWKFSDFEKRFEGFVLELLGEKYAEVKKRKAISLPMHRMCTAYRGFANSYDPSSEHQEVVISLALILDDPAELTSLAAAYNATHPNTPIVLSPSLEDGSLAMSSALMMSFFQPNLDSLLDKTRRIVAESPEMRSLIVLGNVFAEKVLMPRILSEYHRNGALQVIVPTDSHTLAARGAVLYGLHISLPQHERALYSYSVTVGGREEVLVQRGSPLGVDAVFTIHTAPAPGETERIEWRLQRDGEDIAVLVTMSPPDSLRNRRDMRVTFTFREYHIDMEVENARGDVWKREFPQDGMRTEDSPATIDRQVARGDFSAHYGSPEVKQSYMKRMTIALELGTMWLSVAYLHNADMSSVLICAPTAENETLKKAPTALLETPDGEWIFCNAAMTMYEELATNDSNAKAPSTLHLYKDFLQELFDDTTGSEALTATSTCGHAHPLMDLVTRTLIFMKEYAMERASTGRASDLSDEVAWVIIVPPCNDSAKAFLRKAAVHAAIESSSTVDDLLIVESHLAAFNYTVRTQIQRMLMADRYLLLHCETHAMHLSAYQLERAEPLELKRLLEPTFLSDCGDSVHREFDAFLRELLGETLYDPLNAPREFHDIKEEFKSLLKLFNASHNPANLRLKDVLDTNSQLVQLVDIWNANHPEEKVPTTSSLRIGFLPITVKLMTPFCEPFLSAVVEACKAALRDVTGVRHLVITGNIVAHGMLVDRLRAEFHKRDGMDVILTNKAVVAMGVLEYGWDRPSGEWMTPSQSGGSSK